MTEPFIGQIQLYGFNFAPRGWAFCNGATMAIQQNTALFALLGTQYGGNGQTTFMLPNFTTRAGCNQGQAPGLSQRTIGEAFGSPSVTLALQEMPSHNHSLNLYNQGDASKRTGMPVAGAALSVPTASIPFAANAQPNSQFSPVACGPAGSGLPHENRQPYLAANFCIALQGVFPSFG